MKQVNESMSNSKTECEKKDDDLRVCKVCGEEFYLRDWDYYQECLNMSAALGEGCLTDEEQVMLEGRYCPECFEREIEHNE